MSNGIKVLSLDMASKTGYCLLHSWVGKDHVSGDRIRVSQILEHGVIEFEGDRPKRLREFASWLRVMLNTHRDLTAVVFERPFARGRAATRSLWGMAGVAEEVCYGRAACLDVEVNTLKKWAGGAGKGKEPTMAMGRDFLGGTDPLDDNHADAICLAYYAADKIVVG